MSTFIRLAAGDLCLGVLVLGVVAFDFACLHTAPLPGDPDTRPPMAEEATLRRTEAKRHVGEEVIARRRS
jgi:hypothetical protein